MDEYIWRKLKTVTVPNPAGAAWTPALDYLLAKRIYRLTAKDTWQAGQPEQNKWDPDGTTKTQSSTQVLACPGSPFSALIGKIGGGTADNGGGIFAPTTGTTPAKTVSIFAVGRYCVFQVEDAKTGPLYLGINYVTDLPPIITGQITVEIEVAL